VFRHFQPRQPYAVDAFASTGVGSLLSRVPRAAGDARDAPMGVAMPAPRARPPRPLRAPAGRRGARACGADATATRCSTRFPEVRWSADYRPERAPIVRGWWRKT